MGTVAGDRVVADGHGLPSLLDIANEPHHAAGDEPVTRAQEEQEGEEDHATAEQRERRPVWKVDDSCWSVLIFSLNELQKKKESVLGDVEEDHLDEVIHGVV